MGRLDKSLDNEVTLTAKQDGYTLIHFKNTNGDEMSYYVTVSGGGIFINQWDEQ